MLAFAWAFLFGTAVQSIITFGAAAEDVPAVLSSYRVSTHVNSRLATTSIDMIFENENEGCSDTVALTLQLPRNARLTDLTMDLSDGCALNSTVKSLDDAVEDFESLAAEGKAAALLTAWDTANYNLQVSVPPNGTTSVLLKYTELLAQKLSRVDFQVPLFPGTSVRKLEVDVSVEDAHSGILEFGADDSALGEGGGGIETIYGESASTARYVGSEVPTDSSLPALLPVYFRPGPLPDDGLMLADGECFTHLFSPAAFLSEAGSMARRIVFVIDVSGSMSGQKLSDAKASFAAMIGTLDERDTLVVQPFSDEGTEKLWGPKPATAANRDGAKEFVMALDTVGGTNLHQAFLDGIANVYDVPQEVAPVLVILTDGQGNVGPEVTARGVLEANKGGKVKIFSLAFGFDADMDLLLAIAIQNGGRAVRIYEGFGDAVSQMELFYEQELGTIMLSDIDVSYDFGDVGISESTVSRFPVLASGSEVVVRGRVDSLPSGADMVLKSTVRAQSAVGPREWTGARPIVVQDDAGAGDCRASFAQARIKELLEYHDAARAVGDALFGAARGGGGPSFEDRARDIALDARLVWPGLTALVTLENASCQRSAYDVCSASEGRGGGRDGRDDPDASDEAEFASDVSSPQYDSRAGYGSTGFMSGGFTSVLSSSLHVLSAVLALTSALLV